MIEKEEKVLISRSLFSKCKKKITDALEKTIDFGAFFFFGRILYYLCYRII